MKKILKFAMTMTLTMTMLFSVTACGGSSSSTATTTEATTEVAAEATTEATGKTLQTFIEDNDAGQEIVDAMTQEDDTTSITGKVEGNTLTVDATFKETYSEDEIDVMKSSLDDEIGSFDTSFADVKSSFDELIPEEYGLSIKDIKIVVNYYNGDGTLIWSHEF